MREQVRAGAPFDGTARALLTATGDSHAVGPANFARLVGDARGQAELVSQVFLGVRLQCANCHNHPLDRWTQDDYHGLAAVFSRLDRGRVVRVAARGGVTNPRTGEPAVPRIPGDRYLGEAGDGREAFADWLTATDNRYFAKATVNRLWRAMFGRGLVDPTDDLRDTNPATHPELLDRLAADFVAHKFDIRHTLRLIANSEAYGRSAETIRGKPRRRSILLARLPPPARARGVGRRDRRGDRRRGPLRRQSPGHAGDRALRRDDAGPVARCPGAVFAGRVVRGRAGERRPARQAPPAERRVGEPQDRRPRRPAAQLLAAGKTDAEIVAEFYLRALGRSPTNAESDFWQKRLAVADKADRTAVFEDFLWSLLNCSEFTTNR